MADSLVRFQHNKKLLGGNGALGIEATAPKDPALAAILANNEPFPTDQIDLANIKLSGEAGKDVTFGKGKDQASFQANGGAFAGVGVYPDGGTVLAKLGWTPLSPRTSSCRATPASGSTCCAGDIA